MPSKRKTPAQKRRARRKAKEKAIKRAKSRGSSSRGGSGQRRVSRRKKQAESEKPKKKSLLGRLILFSFLFFIATIGGLIAFQGQILNWGFQTYKGHAIQFAQKAGISISELDAQELSVDLAEIEFSFPPGGAVEFASFSTTNA